MSTVTAVDFSNEPVKCPEGARYEKKLDNATKNDFYYIEGCKGIDNKYRGGVIKMYRLDDTLETIYKFHSGEVNGQQYHFYAVNFDTEGRSESVDYFQNENIFYSERLPGYWQAFAESIETNANFTITKPRVRYHDRKLTFYYENLLAIHAEQLKADIEASRVYLINEICSERNKVFMEHLAQDTVSLEVLFSDDKGDVLLKQTISKKDCDNE